MGLIRPGQRVFIGSSCGEPQHLVRELSNASHRLTDIEIVRLMALESTPLTLMADQTQLVQQASQLLQTYLSLQQLVQLKQSVFQYQFFQLKKLEHTLEI